MESNYHKIVTFEMVMGMLWMAEAALKLLILAELTLKGRKMLLGFLPAIL